MTEPKEQQEPSMEEILSSIRRIIADDETDGERADRDLDAAAANADDDEEATDPESATDDTDDVLELTQVVRESGEVVDLSLAAAERNEPIEKAEAGPERGFGEPAAHTEQQPGAAGNAPPSDEPRANPFLATHPRGEPADQSPVSSMQDDGMEKHGTAMPTNERTSDSLISDHALGMATGAFAKLGQAVQRTPPEVAIADDSGRSVEQFVEDMIRPMLREWLDQNMPPLVERIVQREIQKIARRAEID